MWIIEHAQMFLLNRALVIEVFHRLLHIELTSNYFRITVLV